MAKVTATEVLKRIEHKFGLGVLAFDESSYKGTQKRALFACLVNPAHGSWEALANNVLRGQGCPQCGRERVLAAVMARSGVTSLELQSDLSQLGYLADLDPERTYYGKEIISVICSSHGPFTTRLSYIRQGKGCPRCALEKTRARAQEKSAKARERFETEIIGTHGPKIIDLSRTSYLNSKIKVEVGCLREPAHGFWLVLPSNLKKGRGCPKCAAAQRSKIRVKGNATKFKESVIKRHGSGVVDLSHATYTSGNAIIMVGCLRNPAHGWWNTTPTYLLSGRGCPKCARGKRADFQNQRRLKAALILQHKVNEIFGLMAIDTSVGTYLSALEPMKVRCLIDETHGSWMVRPGNLLSGFGCPRCGTARIAQKLASAAKNKFVSRVTEAHGVGVIEVDEAIQIAKKRRPTRPTSSRSTHYL
ncbi:MAG: hypothetical protein E8D40_16695 [Nitrospira sp.]|nr:MAG: hypothetical protein E8D40_16695 [Nitrospira sp.]